MADLRDMDNEDKGKIGIGMAAFGILFKHLKDPTSTAEALMTDLEKGALALSNFAEGQDEDGPYAEAIKTMTLKEVAMGLYHHVCHDHPLPEWARTNT